MIRAPLLQIPVDQVHVDNFNSSGEAKKEIIIHDTFLPLQLTVNVKIFRSVHLDSTSALASSISTTTALKMLVTSWI